MKLSTVLAFGVVLLFLVFGLAYGSKVCYHAKTCIHNGREKCGITSSGQVRRFFDSCDIQEYNCLKGTDYEKTAIEKCAKLPPIPPEEKNREK